MFPYSCPGMYCQCIVILFIVKFILKNVKENAAQETQKIFKTEVLRNGISGILNLMNTELFYSQILNLNRDSLHRRSFMPILLSGFRYRLTKGGFAGLKSFRSF